MNHVKKGKKETGWDQCFLRGHWARSHDSRAKENEGRKKFTGVFLKNVNLVKHLVHCLNAMLENYIPNFEGFTLKSVHSIRTRGRVILPPKMVFELQSHDAA